MRFPSDLPPVQHKMVAHGYRPIVSMRSCWKFAKPFLAIVPMFSLKMDQTNYFFPTKWWKQRYFIPNWKVTTKNCRVCFGILYQDKIRNWLIEVNTLSPILSDMRTLKYQHLILTIICSSPFSLHIYIAKEIDILLFDILLLKNWSTVDAAAAPIYLGSFTSAALWSWLPCTLHLHLAPIETHQLCKNCAPWLPCI